MQLAGFECISAKDVIVRNKFTRRSDEILPCETHRRAEEMHRFDVERQLFRPLVEIIDMAETIHFGSRWIVTVLAIQTQRFCQ